MVGLTPFRLLQRLSCCKPRHSCLAWLDPCLINVFWFKGNMNNAILAPLTMFRILTMLCQQMMLCLQAHPNEIH